MRKSILLLAAFTSTAIIVAVLAVMKYSVRITVAFLPVIVLFLILAALLIRRSRIAEFAAHSGASDNGRTALKWLSVPFVIGAIGAVVMTSEEGWNTGDTIGAIVFGIFAILMGYELMHRRPPTHSR